MTVLARLPLIVAMSLTLISIYLGTVFCIQAIAAKDSILLTLTNSSFASLSTVHGNQVLVSVKYQVNDKSFENEKINGIMKLYSSNGSLIHSSSFPDGFTAKKKGGQEEFKTTIRDPSIQGLIANVTLTDLKKTETISNTVSTKLELKKSSGPTSGTD